MSETTADQTDRSAPRARQIRIQHISPTWIEDESERDKLFEPEKREILFGTLPHCDVRFRGDAPGVHREHLVLERDVGRYELRVDTTSPVFINGRPALDGEELRAGDELVLGDRRQGPRIRIAYDNDHEAYGPVADRGRDETAILLRSVFVANLALVVLLVLGCAVGGYLWWDYGRQQEIRNAIESEISNVAKPRTTSREHLSAAVRRHRDSVYMVLLSTDEGSDGIGTAWVVGPGLLATNAHVAKLFQDLDPARARLQARSPNPDLPLATVVDVVIHPAYSEFELFWSQSQPSRISAAGRREGIEFVPGYDVALLEVEEDLADPIPIATREELAKTGIGDQIAYLGYPSEGVIDMSSGLPNPVAHLGSIINLSDFGRQRSTSGATELIVHSAPGTGGVSGSPILSADGSVIALFSSGSVANINRIGQRVPSAALVNFGQSTATLSQLITGDEVDIDGLRSSWEASLALLRLDSPAERVQELIRLWSEAQKRRGAAADPDAQLEAQIEIDGEERLNGYPAAIATVDLDPGHYLAYSWTTDAPDIDLLVFMSQDGAAPVLMAKDDAPDPNPIVEFSIRSAATIRMVIADPNRLASARDPIRSRIGLTGYVPR